MGKPTIRTRTERSLCRNRAPRCCAIGACCRKTLAPRTLQYTHSVLASALAHGVREDQLPRNVAKLVTVNPDRPRRFEPLTLEEARALMAAAQTHRLHAPFELNCPTAASAPTPR